MTREWRARGADVTRSDRDASDETRARIVAFLQLAEPPQESDVAYRARWVGDAAPKAIAEHADEKVTTPLGRWQTWKDGDGI